MSAVAEIVRIPLEQALEKLLASVRPLSETETLPLLEAAGRVAAEDVVSHMDQPPFNRSPFDGYAFHHEDTASAGPERPVFFPVVQLVHAGEVPAGPLPRGHAIRIMTGTILPDGADCVARQEDARQEPDRVGLSFALRRNENVCLRGEDLPAGQVLLRKGEKINFAHIGVLAGQGLVEARCFKKPSVAALSTGDELAQPGAALGPGKIYNSNDIMLGARLAAQGMRPVVAGASPDLPETLAARVSELLALNDLVLTTGGVSVGKKDYMPEVIRLLGGEILFHGVDVKPGSAVMAATVGGKPVLALSGNPFAAQAVFEVLAVPVLKKLAGLGDFAPRRIRVISRSAFSKPSLTRRMIRAHCAGGEVFIPDGGHSAGMLKSLIECNCLIDLPAGAPQVTSGSLVDVILFQ